ncbi:hypothetical protein GN956_G5231 [Arapaima gigas]
MFDNLHCVLPSTPPLRPPPPPQLDHASLHTPVRRHAHHLIRDSPALRPATTWRQLCTALPNLTRRLLVEGLCLDHHTCAALKDLQRQNAVQQLSPTKRRREKGSSDDVVVSERCAVQRMSSVASPQHLPPLTFTRPPSLPLNHCGMNDDEWDE